MTVAQPPAGPPATSIADVITRMEAIDGALPAHDGLACFNRMYLLITQQVDQRIGQGLFADPAFMTRLDVVFANLYFDAVDAAAGRGPLPAAWQPLLSQRDNPGIDPIQFALAGMNAHINHDLPVSVVATCRDLNTAPEDGTRHQDYQKVDQLLDDAEQSVRQSFETGVLLEADRHTQAVDNLVCSWSITESRDIAWDNALALWAVRDHPLVTDLFLAGLSRTVAVASRALLVAV